MKRIVLTIFICAAVFACRKHDGTMPKQDDFVKLSQTLVESGSDAAQVEIEIQSSSKWTVAGFADWLTLDKKQGQSGEKLKLSIAKNTEGNKELELKIFSGKAVAKLLVKSHLDFFISADKNSATVEAEGKIISLAINTNVSNLEYKVEAIDWLSIKPIYKKDNVVKYAIQVEESKLYKERMATINFFSKDKEGITFTYTITQGQKDFAAWENVENDAILLNKLEEEEKELKLKANIEPEFTLPTWITKEDKGKTEVDSDGLTTYTYALKIAASEDSRSEDILVKKAGGATLLKTKVTQKNPNPVKATINNNIIRKIFIDKKYIFATDPGSTEVEVLKAGQELKTLELVVDDYSDITLGNELKAFTKLEKLKLGSFENEVLELSSLTNLKEIELVDFENIKSIKCPDACTSLKITSVYSTLKAESIVFEGKGLTTINMSKEGEEIENETLESIDVSMCPNLTTLNAKRSKPSGGGDDGSEEVGDTEVSAAVSAVSDSDESDGTDGSDDSSDADDADESDGSDGSDDSGDADDAGNAGDSGNSVEDEETKFKTIYVSEEQKNKFEAGTLKIEKNKTTEVKVKVSK